MHHKPFGGRAPPGPAGGGYIPPIVGLVIGPWEEEGIKPGGEDGKENARELKQK